MEEPAQQAMQDQLGISQTYASMILRGVRVPSRPLAIKIFRLFGWRHESIAALTDEQIDMLETLDPWVPTADRQDAEKAA